MEIKKLILNNFQQWKNGNILFTKGLNILVGDTECGKSTLFRAISSIITGKMQEDYVRKGSKGCEVELEFSNGNKFKRIRNKKENIAQVNDLVYERVGKEIPSEYFKILGNTNITFGDKKISLCLYSQFDSHFFITLSDYEKSKLIGTICGIDIVDKLIDNINSDIRDTKTTIKYLNNEIEKDYLEKEMRQKEFSLLESKYLNIKPVKEKIELNYDFILKLEKLNCQLKDLNGEIKKNEDLFKENNKYSFDFKEKIILLEKLNKQNYLKQDIDKQIFDLSNIFSNNDNLLKQTTKSDLKINSNDLDKLYNLKIKLEKINTEISINANIKNKIDNDLYIFVKVKGNLLNDIDKCPLCGNIINK